MPLSLFIAKRDLWSVAELFLPKQGLSVIYPRRGSKEAKQHPHPELIPRHLDAARPPGGLLHRTHRSRRIVRICLSLYVCLFLSLSVWLASTPQIWSGSKCNCLSPLSSPPHLPHHIQVLPLNQLVVHCSTHVDNGYSFNCSWTELFIEYTIFHCPPSLHHFNYTYYSFIIILDTTLQNWVK